MLTNQSGNGVRSHNNNLVYWKEFNNTVTSNFTLNLQLVLLKLYQVKKMYYSCNTLSGLSVSNLVKKTLKNICVHLAFTLQKRIKIL